METNRTQIDIILNFPFLNLHPGQNIKKTNNKSVNDIRRNSGRSKTSTASVEINVDIPQEGK